MPFILVLISVSVLLWKLFGNKKRETNKQCMKVYREEFLNYFPTILTILVDRRVLNPRVKTAYNHLEEVSSLPVTTKVLVLLIQTYVTCLDIMLMQGIDKFIDNLHQLLM